MKERTVEPTAEQQRFHDWLRATVTRCEACCSARDLVLHHCLPSVERCHWRVVIICARCHNVRTDSVHLLGSEEKFFEVHGVFLPAWAKRRLEEWRATQ